jgi:hypothetical protein
MFEIAARLGADERLGALVRLVSPRKTHGAAGPNDRAAVTGTGFMAGKILGCRSSNETAVFRHAMETPMFAIGAFHVPVLI